MCHSSMMLLFGEELLALLTLPGFVRAEAAGQGRFSSGLAVEQVF